MLDTPTQVVDVRAMTDLKAKELRLLAEQLRSPEARLLVDAYYQGQNSRIRYGNRASAIKRTTGITSEVFELMENDFLRAEKKLATLLDYYTRRNPVSVWMRSIGGVGPVMSAGFLSRLDIRRAPHASSFWSVAGLNPNMVWEKGQKIPFNRNLKKLCFLLGESFVKVGRQEDNIYPQIIKQARRDYWDKNLRGDYVDTAEALSRKFGRGTEAYKWYAGAYSGVRFDEKGKVTPILATPTRPGLRMLPPGQIFMRSKRKAVKIFLGHLHHVWFEQYHGRPAPVPYAFLPKSEGGLGHELGSRIWPPNYEPLTAPMGAGEMTEYQRYLLTNPLPDLHAAEPSEDDEHDEMMADITDISEIGREE